jgi:hypothetical protein
VLPAIKLVVAYVLRAAVLADQCLGGFSDGVIELIEKARNFVHDFVDAVILTAGSVIAAGNLIEFAIRELADADDV